MFGVRYDPRKRRMSESSDSSEASEAGSAAGSESARVSVPVLATSAADSAADSVSEASEAQVSDDTDGSDGTDNTDSSGSSDAEDLAGSDADAKKAKFASIFSRLEKSIKRAETAETPVSSSSDEEQHVEERDLAPVPQPELPRDTKLKQVASQSLNWLAKPVYFSPSATAQFDEFLRVPALLHNLQSMGCEKAFSVQAAVLSAMSMSTKTTFIDHNNGDLLVNAPTGSGKTLAYVVPIFADLSRRVVPRLACVVLVPTRPLVSQVFQTMTQLNRGINLNIMASSSNVSISRELRKLATQKVDVLVTTPGRFVDYLRLETENGSEALSLKYLRYLVIDEVDRLMDQSFHDWIRVMNDAIEANKVDRAHEFGYRVQKMFFSATLANDVAKLAQVKFYKPRLLVVAENGAGAATATATATGSERTVQFQMVPNLSEYEIFVPLDNSALKPLVLAKSLLERARGQKVANVLVFVGSNEASIRLAKILQLVLAKFQSDVEVQCINASLSANTRKSILNRFAKQKVHILVATDLVARGIDILSIEAVFNYDMPISAADYVHRVGRCARANQKGDAVTMICGNKERKWFSRLSAEITRQRPVAALQTQQVEEYEKKLYADALKTVAQM